MNLIDRIPDWGKSIIEPDGPIERLVFDWYAARTATTEMKKLKSGYLLKEMLDHCTNKSQGTLSPDRSIWMYFAHDHTINNFLHTLDLYKVQFHIHFCKIFYVFYGSNCSDFL